MSTAAELISEYRRPLRSLMYDRSVPVHAHKDILQDVWIQLNTAISRGKFDVVRDPFNYVYTITVREIIRWRKKNARCFSDADNELVSARREDIEGEVDAARMIGIVRTLPSKQRALVESIIEGYTIPEHAAALEESRFTVWRRWKVTEQTLRRKLAA